MKRHSTIRIVIVAGLIALAVACAVIWETVPYVRYMLIPVTGGTRAPTSLTRSGSDTHWPQKRYADSRPLIMQPARRMHDKEPS